MMVSVFVDLLYIYNYTKRQDGLSFDRSPCFFREKMRNFKALFFCIVKGGRGYAMAKFFKKRNMVNEDTVNDVLLEAILRNQPINRKDALTLPAVSGAVDYICGTIASMPVKLYKYKKGKVESVDDDIRVTLLNGDTGDTLDGYQMKKAVVEDYLLGKGGYIFISRDRNDVNGLYYVKDTNISFLMNNDPIYKDYAITVDAQNYYPYEFIKLLRNTKNGAWGVGLCNEVSKALETAFNTLLYQLSLVKSGGNKKGFIKSQRKLTQDAIDVLKRSWSEMYSNNSTSAVVLNDGLEFQEASNSSVEMQLNESKRTLQEEINNIFHIYPNDESRTFKECIYPIVKAFETALNRDLLLEKEKGKYFFKFDVKEIVKANVKERYEAYQIAKNIGLKTINELRQEEDLNYIDGLDIIDLGLGSALYNVDTGEIYTPNTDTVKTVEEEGAEDGII